MKAHQSVGFKISPQALLTMFLVALVPLAGFWLVNNIRVQCEMRANAEQNLRDASSALAAGANGWSDANVRALRQNASLPDIASIQFERQAPVLATMPATYDWMYSAFVTNGDGFISARGDEPILNEDGSYLEDRSDREYYKLMHTELGAFSRAELNSRLAWQIERIAGATAARNFKNGLWRVPVRVRYAALPGNT